MACVCTLDVSRALVRYVAKLLAAGRGRVGTRRDTRRLTPFHQARFALAYLRDRVEVERLGAGFGLSRATAYRYLKEAVRVLSDQAPEPHEALERAAEDEIPHPILDGTIIATDRPSETKISKKGNEIDSWYSGKTHGFGGNYEDARCGVLTPVPKPTDGIPLHADQRTYNRLLRGLRRLGERGFAPLVERRQALRRVTMSPKRITDLARAALVPTHFEHDLIS